MTEISKELSEIATSSASHTLDLEMQGLAALRAALEKEMASSFEQAISIISKLQGRVIVTGVGKSGHVGTKLAATLASTGTPAFFVHAAEANHGDLGMIARDDAVIAISWSGNTAELKGILAYATRFSIPVIAMTKSENSALGKEATVCLELPQVKEACPHNLAPTTSTIMQMALGDALAIALLETKGFSADDFSIYHPGGSLGASLTRVSEIMHKNDSIPLIGSRATVKQAVDVISQMGFGCVGVLDENDCIAGIVTDGDLRRNINRDMSDLAASTIMTKYPQTVSPETLATSAMALLNQKSITVLFVVEDGKPVGLVHLHDLLKVGAA